MTLKSTAHKLPGVDIELNEHQPKLQYVSRRGKISVMDLLVRSNDLQREAFLSG